MSVTICKDDLIKLGYKKYQAISLIREAKAIMVQKGCPYYNNKRLGQDDMLLAQWLSNYISEKKIKNPLKK